MKVICIGVPRTGTATTTEALKVLGYNAFHEAIYFNAELLDRLDVKGVTALKELRVFDEYDAITGSIYWRHLCMAYEDAKIVLLTRDLDKWFASIRKHINMLHTGRDMPREKGCFPCDSMGARWVMEYGGMIHERVFGSRWPMKGLYVERFLEHQMAVTHWCEKMGRDMIMYGPTIDGWGPLCEFLGHEVPEQDFPWRNKRG